MDNLEAIEILTYMQDCCNQCECNECPHKEDGTNCKIHQAVSIACKLLTKNSSTKRGEVMNGLKSEFELRPCYVDECKALFHCWERFANVIPPEITIGGHDGGQVSCMYGIVEFDDGHIETIVPSKITFCDSRTKEYDYELN